MSKWAEHYVHSQLTPLLNRALALFNSGAKIALVIKNTGPNQNVFIGNLTAEEVSEIVYELEGAKEDTSGFGTRRVD
jgi:hypothetical protein